jgi:hypothetical protein
MNSGREPYMSGRSGVVTGLGTEGAEVNKKVHCCL